MVEIKILHIETLTSEIYKPATFPRRYQMVQNKGERFNNRKLLSEKQGVAFKTREE